MRIVRLKLTELPEEIVLARRFARRTDGHDALPIVLQRLGFNAHAERGTEVDVEVERLHAMGFSERRLPSYVKLVQVVEQ